MLDPETDLYTISEDQKLQFAGIYLLEHMVSKNVSYPILLREQEQDLEPILEWLLVRQHVAIKGNERYEVTDHGRQALGKFAKRYQNFLREFDVFSAVDLQSGEFALASYYDFETDEQWRDYLDSDQWEDLRVAVADYKDLDPVETVFMSFINEGRFGRDSTGWQFDLLLGTVWDEILDICNNALDEDDLAYDGVSGEDVLRDVIAQGEEVMRQMIVIESEQENQNRPLPTHEADNWGRPNAGGENLRSQDTDFHRFIDEDGDGFDDREGPPPGWRGR